MVRECPTITWLLLKLIYTYVSIERSSNNEDYHLRD